MPLDVPEGEVLLDSVLALESDFSVDGEGSDPPADLPEPPTEPFSASCAFLRASDG